MLYGYVKCQCQQNLPVPWMPAWPRVLRWTFHLAAGVLNNRSTLELLPLRMRSDMVAATQGGIEGYRHEANTCPGRSGTLRHTLIHHDCHAIMCHMIRKHSRASSHRARYLAHCARATETVSVDKHTTQTHLPSSAPMIGQGKGGAEACLAGVYYAYILPTHLANSRHAILT